MEIGKWKLAQAWRHFKRPASSKGMWKQFVDASKERDQRAEVISHDFDELSPREEQYYQKPPFSTNEVFLASKGGTPQLVQPGPGRPGYSGKTISERRTEKTLKTLDKHLPALEEYIEKNASKYKDGDEFYDAAIKHFKNNPKHEGFVKSSFSRQFGKNELFDIPVPMQKRTKEAKKLATYSYRNLFDLKASAPINLKRYVKDMMWINMLEKNKAYNKSGGLADNLIKYFSGEELAPEKLNEVRKWTGKHLKATEKTSNLVRNFFKSKAPNFDEVRKLWQTSEGNLAELRKLMKNPNLSEGYLKKVKNAVASIERHRVFAGDMREEFPKLFKKESLTSFPRKSKTLKIETMEGEHRVPKASNTATNKLPKTYLLRTEEVPGTFNVIKMNEFDKPLIDLMEKYKNASSAERKDIQKKITDLHEGFNKNSGGYLDELTFKFDADKGTVTIRDTMPLSKKLGYDDYKRRAAKNMQHMQSYIKNTKPYKKFAFNPKELKKFTDSIFQAFRANGIGKNCPINKAEGGRIGFAEAGIVDDKCMRNAINEHKKKLANGNEAAINKQMKINKTKGLKNMFTMGRKGLQSIISGVGLDHPGAAALEVAIEAAFYGYGRQEGESHEQARENLFFPKILEKMVPDVVKDTELWKKYGIKPFKTGIMGGPEKLIEEELIGTRWDPSGKVNRAAEYADGMKALEDEYANASKIDFELGLLKNQWQPGSEEEIEAKEQELRDSYGRIEELQINIKEGTPAHDAYVAAQEKQKALRDERAQDYYGDSPAYKGSKQRQWQKEFLDYRGADRKYRKEQPFAFKGGKEANIGPTKEELAKGMNINWEEVFPRTIDTPRTTEQQKWDYIMNQGGFDLMDKISAAGGVANMAEGGIVSLLKK